MILILILHLSNTFPDSGDTVIAKENTVELHETDKNRKNREPRSEISPTRTPIIVYYYYKETQSEPFLIAAIVILSIVIVASFIVVVVACLKRERGEIYADNVGPLSKPNDAGTVIIKSVYFTHVDTDEKQPDEQ